MPIICKKYSLPYLRTAILCMIVLGLSPQIGSAQVSSGGYSETYLFRNIGARAISMAGAYSAVVNEPAGIYYNPAGIGFMNEIPTVSASVSILGLGRSYNSLTWAQQIMPNFGVGFGFNALSTPEFTARDIMGNQIGTISAMQYNIALAAAYSLEFMSMGISVKYLNHGVSGISGGASGFAVDLGTKFNVMDMFSVGIAMQNISAMMFWDTPYEPREDIPFRVRAGVAMEFALNDETYITRSTTTGEQLQIYVPATRYVLVSSDLVITQFEENPTWVIGTEAVPHELIAFRGGIAIYGDKYGQAELFPMTYWGAGVSIRPDLKENLPFKFNVDYSLSNEYLTESGLAHHISIVFEF